MAKQFQGKKNMDVVTYTGNGDTQSISGLDFSPDLVWVKGRNAANGHNLQDTIRGTDSFLQSHTSSEELTNTTKVTSFDTNGFSVGSNSGVNNSGDTYVAWCWDAGEETVEYAADSIEVAANNSEVWSGGAITNSTDVANAFDGDLNNAWTVSGGNGTASILTFTNPIAGSKFRVYMSGFENDSGGAGFAINGVSNLNGSAPTLSSGVTWWDFSSTVAANGGTLQSITIYKDANSQQSVMGIEVDGKLLIDAGVVVPTVNDVASTVRANPEAGFSVVTYTGSGSAGSVGHGLSSPPVFAFIKSRTNANGWAVYHKSLPQGDNLTLNTDNTHDAYDMFPTAPTDQVFNFSGNTWVNGGNDYVAYCWSEVPGYSKAGQYTGDGSTSNFVYTGFKPQWLLVKRNATSGWVLWDNARPDTAYLQPNNSNAEAEGLKVNAVSNGFEIANSNGQYNGSGGTYYFMAFAEKPLFRPKRVALEFQDTQDFDEILEGDNLTEYTLAGPGESGKVESKDETTNKVIALVDDISSFTTDGTRSMTKPVTDPSNKRWTWSGWIKRSAINKPQYAFKAGTFVVGFNEDNQLFAGNVPVDVYVTTEFGGATLSYLLDRSTLWTGQDIATNESIFIVPRDRNVAGASAKAFYSAFDMPLGGRSADQGGVYDAGGSSLGYIGSYQGYEFPQYFTYVGNETAVGGTYDIPTQDNVGYLYLKNYNSTAGSLGQLDVAYGVTTTASYTDTSTWMHVTVTCNTISGEGFKLYVDGDEVTNFWSQVQPPVNYSFNINTTGTEQSIGVTSNLTFSGYTADVQFYDGQVVTPSNLVYNDPTNENLLSPAAPTKWFGTRGYHLDFGDRRSPDLFTQDVSGNDDNWSSSNVSVVGHSEATTAPITETVDNIIPTQYTTNTWGATSGQPLSPATQRPPAGEYRVINLDVTDFNINNAGGYGQLGWSTSNTFNTNQYNTDMCGIYLNGDNGDAVYLNPGGPTAIGPAGFTNGAALYKVKDPSGPTGERGWALTNDGTYLTGSIQFIFDGYGNVWLMFNGDYMYANGTTTFDPTSDVMDYTKGVDGFPLWINFPDNQVFGLNTQVGDSSRYTIDTNGFVEGSTLTFSNSTNLEVASVGDTVTQGEVTSTVKSSDVRNKTLTVSDLGFSVNSTVTLNSTLTAGDVDSVVDTPNKYGEDDGLGGEQRGNYCTLSASDMAYEGSTLSNGNLTIVGSYDSYDQSGFSRGTIGVDSGKWYWEVTVGEADAHHEMIGVSTAEVDVNYWLGADDGAWAVYAATGYAYHNGAASTTTSGAAVTGDVYGVALDIDAGTLQFYKNGVAIESYSNLYAATYFPGVGPGAVQSYGRSNDTVNFGATPFKYPAPVGYKTLNTTNIEDGLVVQGNTAMDTVLYTGNGETQTISGLNFSPDLVWIKNRTQTSSHNLSDTVRGVGKVLFPDDSDREYDQTPISSFNSDGFTLTNDAAVNLTGDDFVAWCWDAGDNAPAPNTAGTLASTVKANPTTGFSITTWTGTGSIVSLGHGLGVAPKFIIVKNRTGSFDWPVYHASLAYDQSMRLSTSEAASGWAYFNSTAPTSSVFQVGSSAAATGNNGDEMVAYLWAEVPGYSSFGEYSGNGQESNFVHTGFKPAWVMIKRVDSIDNWYMYDNKRDGILQQQLTADIGDAEYDATTYPSIDLHSSGFKLNGTIPGRNALGGTYVYMAFAELPQQYLPQ